MLCSHDRNEVESSPAANNLQKMAHLHRKIAYSPENHNSNITQTQMVNQWIDPLQHMISLFNCKCLYSITKHLSSNENLFVWSWCTIHTLTIDVVNDVVVRNEWTLRFPLQHAYKCSKHHALCLKFYGRHDFMYGGISHLLEQTRPWNIINWCSLNENEVGSGWGWSHFYCLFTYTSAGTSKLGLDVHGKRFVDHNRPLLLTQTKIWKNLEICTEQIFHWTWKNWNLEWNIEQQFLSERVNWYSPQYFGIRICSGV